MIHFMESESKLSEFASVTVLLMRLVFDFIKRYAAMAWLPSPLLMHDETRALSMQKVV